jgi:cell division protein ZapA (FtsZ GTPase activity inhibitor)
MHTVEVTILGQTYRLKSDKDPAYMESLASKLNSRISEVASHAPTVDAVKLLTLTALNLVDRLEELEAQRGDDLRRTEERANKLLDRLNDVLEAKVE